MASRRRVLVGLAQMDWTFNWYWIARLLLVSEPRDSFQTSCLCLWKGARRQTMWFRRCNNNNNKRTEWGAERDPVPIEQLNLGEVDLFSVCLYVTISYYAWLTEWVRMELVGGLLPWRRAIYRFPSRCPIYLHAQALPLKKVWIWWTILVLPNEKLKINQSGMLFLKDSDWGGIHGTCRSSNCRLGSGCPPVLL